MSTGKAGFKRNKNGVRTKVKSRKENRGILSYAKILKRVKADPDPDVGKVDGFRN